MRAPPTAVEVITESAGPSSGRDSGGSGGVNGSPNTTGDVEKHFERDGWTIEEIAAADIPAVANDRKDVAFCITDTHDPLDGTIRASDPIAVFTRGGDDHEVSLGEHFDNSAALFRAEDRAEGCEVRGFGVDAREDGKGVKIQSDRGCRLRDVTVRGVMDGRGDWPTGMYFTVPQGETVALENVRVPGGASRGDVTSTHDSIGVLLDGRSDGKLRVDNCVIGPHPNNGAYCSGPRKRGNKGKAIIENSTFYGSDRDNVRVGNDSTVRNCTFYTDKKRSGFDNLRMVWIRQSRGVTVENNTMRTFPGTDPGEAIRVDSTAASATIRNNTIELRGDHHAARGLCAYSPDEEARNAGANIVVEDNLFHGDATNLRDVILIKKGRAGSTIRGNEIDVPGAQQRVDFRR